MFIYWVMFTFPALAALSTVKYHKQVTDLSWFFVALFFIVIIGFRWEVGADWKLYNLTFNNLRDITLIEGMKIRGFGDPGYTILSWVGAKIGFNVSAINLVCATVLITGLFCFCRQQPQPWLAVVVATPVVVIIIGMGLTRQSGAIGCEFFALLALLKKRMLRFCFFVGLGVSFHKSAILLAPIGILVNTKRRLPMVVLLSLLVGFSLWLQPLDTLLLIWESYKSYRVSNGIAQLGMLSPGSYVRVAMNAFPALLFLFYRKRFKLNTVESSIWTWMSIIALSSVPQLALMTSTTVVDRIAMYFIPIQIFVYSRFQCLFKPVRSQQFATAIVIGVYAAVQFTWFNFGNHSYAWVPYKFLSD